MEIADILKMNKTMEQLKIAVLAGGIGSEREVSLMSGKTIYEALRCGGSDVVISDITPEEMSILEDTSIDVFFLALHGQFGEDGQLQKILEDRNLCFTGSGSQSSRNSFNKILSKQAFFHSHMPVARHAIVHAEDDEARLSAILERLAEKFVVKPICQGSSVGVTIVDNPKQAAVKAIECFRTYGDCMVEEFIGGREVTVGIVNGAPLPIIEIRSKAQFYDFYSKYIDDMTEYLFDTIENKNLVDDIQRLAVTAFRELDCRHLGRVDFIVSDDDVPYALEINTLPGFTSHSLLPMAAKKAGIPLPILCRKIVEAALKENRSDI